MAADRRPLTAGLSVVPPGADPEAVRAFITQERKPKEEPLKPEPAPKQELQPEVEDEPQLELRAPKKPKRSKKGPLPVGLIPVTVRLKPELAAALKRASLERQLAGEDVYTQQDLVELALEPWLREQGFLA